MHFNKAMIPASFLFIEHNLLYDVGKTRLRRKKKIISAPYCQIMRIALGSSAAQSAAAITSDVSHCLGIARQEQSGSRLAWTGGSGAVYQRGLLLRLPCGTLQVLARASSSTVHRLKPLQLLNTHNLSRSWPDFLCPSFLFNTVTDHATSLLCQETFQIQRERSDALSPSSGAQIYSQLPSGF